MATLFNPATDGKCVHCGKTDLDHLDVTRTRVGSGGGIPVYCATSAVPVADTQHKNAVADYERIRIEAIALAERILAGLQKADMDGEPINWGHVGTMAHYRSQLREVNDSMFHEGEYAEDAPLTGDALAAFVDQATGRTTGR